MAMRRLHHLLIALLITGCATPVEGPPFERQYVDGYPGQAIVYVYRPSFQFNYGGYPDIFINGERKFSLKENGYRVFTLSPGNYEIKAEGAFNWYPPPAVRTLSVEAGREYFVRVIPFPLANPKSASDALRPEGDDSPAPLALFVPGRLGRTIISLVPSQKALHEIHKTQRIME